MRILIQLTESSNFQFCYLRLFGEVILFFHGSCACSVWVARRPPGYAFIDFDDRRDAQDAIRELDGMCRRIIKMY